MKKTKLFLLVIFLASFAKVLPAQVGALKELSGFDIRMEKIMAEWKVPGCAIGIVKGGKLIYAKGFGIRDVEKNLPVTINTLFPIASNTKLFTATAAGLLVHEGKLQWDKPLRTFVPEIQFYNNELTNEITLRDMLSHRTGMPRYDEIADGSSFTREELFKKLRFMKPTAGLRERFQYNNMMFTAAGHITGKVSGKSWEDFVKEKLLLPLKMYNTVFSVAAMEKTVDYAKGYQNKTLNDANMALDYYRFGEPSNPAGGIISNVTDLSNWVICQLNKGSLDGKQVIPNVVIDDTYTPSSFSDLPVDGKEFSYRIYGMGREMTTYKGHLMSYHGGRLPGFISDIAFFPHDDMGVIVLTNSGNNDLRWFLSLEIADRILNLGNTKWHERYLEKKLKELEEEKKLNEKAIRVKQKTAPAAHDLKDFTGVYENEVYGKIDIRQDSGKLFFHFNNYIFQVNNVNYDHFETTEHWLYGKFKLSFLTNENGEVDTIISTLDNNEVAFKKPKVNSK